MADEQAVVNRTIDQITGHVRIEVVSSKDRVASKMACRAVSLRGRPREREIATEGSAIGYIPVMHETPPVLMETQDVLHAKATDSVGESQPK
jgi:hypothetical protein